MRRVSSVRRLKEGSSSSSMPEPDVGSLGRTSPRGPHVGEALPAEHRVVGHVDRLDAGRARDLHQQRLVVPHRVEAGHGREALEPPPVPEREGPHSGHERAPSGQRRHRLRNRAVEAQRLLRQLVQVRRLGRRVALERVHVVGAHQRKHHEQRARGAVVAELRRRGCGARQATRARPRRRRWLRRGAAGFGA